MSRKVRDSYYYKEAIASGEKVDFGDNSFSTLKIYRKPTIEYDTSGKRILLFVFLSIIAFFVGLVISLVSIIKVVGVLVLIAGIVGLISTIVIGIKTEFKNVKVADWILKNAFENGEELTAEVLHVEHNFGKNNSQASSTGEVSNEYFSDITVNLNVHFRFEEKTKIVVINKTSYNKFDLTEEHNEIVEYLKNNKTIKVLYDDKEDLVFILNVAAYEECEENSDNELTENEEYDNSETGIEKENIEK